MMRSCLAACAALAGALAFAPQAAAEIRGQPDPRLAAALDIIRAEIRIEQSWALFRIELRGPAGGARVAPAAPARQEQRRPGQRPPDQRRPEQRGPEQRGPAPRTIVAYVWPTSIDPSVVGFERASGTLALAVMAHPGFDDTPLFDENADGDSDNDGNSWHVHWLVLVPDDSCGRGALRVRDLPPGGAERPRASVPRTWPGLPVLIDSPGYAPRFVGSTIEVRVPFADLAGLRGASFDALTAELRRAPPGTVPLLCVAPVDSASGNLSLPGRIE